MNGTNEMSQNLDGATTSNDIVSPAPLLEDFLEPAPVPAFFENDLFAQESALSSSDTMFYSSAIPSFATPSSASLPHRFRPSPPRATTAHRNVVVQPQQSHSTSTRSKSYLRRPLTERERFLVFVKILFRCMSDDHSVQSQAKAIVADCTRRNRLGERGYIPLQSAVEYRLRGTVGEHYWRSAKSRFDRYCYEKGLHCTPTVVARV